MREERKETEQENKRENRNIIGDRGERNKERKKK